MDSASTSADDGIVRITSSSAANTAASIQFRNNTGAAAGSTLQLDGTLGALAITPPVSLSGRNSPAPAIENLAGNNTLSGNISITSGGGDYRVQADAGMLTLGGLISSSASGTRTFTFQGDGNTLISGSIANGSAATFNITKAGAGTLFLSGANTYNGSTTINGGTLVLGAAGAIASSAQIVVTNGATLDVSPVAGGFVLNAGQTLCGSGVVTGSVTAASGSAISPGSGPGTLTFTNNLALAGGNTLFFELSNDPNGTNNDLIAVAGNLNLSGANTFALTLVSGALPTGRYKLISYNGTRTGGAANFSVTILGVPPNVLVSVDDSIPNEIDLLVTSFAGSLTWQGDGSLNRWDGGVSANWLNGSTNSVFVTGDSVTFDDSATNQTVSLMGSLLPGLVTVSSSSHYTFTGSGTLNGATGLIKNGGGTLTILTTNANTGSIAINAGTVQVGNGTASGALGTGDINNNGALVFNHANPLVLASAISGSGTFTKLGAGTLLLSGNNSFSGGTVFSAGVISNASSTAFGSGPVVITNQAQQWMLASGVTVTNAISVAGPMGVVGTGIIKGPPTGSAAVIGPVTFTVQTPNGGATTNGGAFDGGNTTGGLVVSGPVIFTGGFIHQRANRVTYSGGGSYKLFQDSGAVALGADDGLATNAVLEIGSSSSATFDLAGFNQTLNGLQKGGNTATVGNSSKTNDSLLTISGVSSNTTYAGSIQNALSGGTCKVALAVNGGTFSLSGANTFSGDTRLAGGTLTLANSAALQNSPLNLAAGDAGTLNFGSLTAASVGGLKGARNLALNNAAAAAVALTVGAGNTNLYTYAGALTGSGSVTKTGAGTFVLTGTNTFTGVLNVDTAQPSVGNDGTLRLASPGTLNGAASIAIRNMNSATSTLQLDGTAGSLSLAQSISLNGRNNSVAAIENLAGNNSVNGSLSLGGGGAAYLLQSDSDRLTFNGVLGIHSLTSARFLTFQGAGDFWVAGVITNGASFANSVIKTGTGMLTLAAINTYTGTTVVSNGTLLVNGSLGTNTVMIAGGTLGGSGVIRGPVTVAGGSTLSPGAASGVTRTLTVSNSLSLSGTTFMALNAAAGTNDLVAGVTSLNYGGTFAITNLGGTLNPGSSFKLFSAAAFTGSFLNSTGSFGGGLGWTFNPTNGVLSVISTTAANPTNVAASVTDGALTLSWPADHLGWILQAQTNELGAGLSTNWVDIAGSETNNTRAINLDPASPTVFFRLRHP